MQVPQTVQMTYWSHQHFLGATTVVKSLLCQKKKSIFSSLHHSVSLLFRVNIKVFQTTQWCLGAPATSIWPSTICCFFEPMTPRLVPESLKWKLASSPPKKNKHTSFLLFNRSLLHFYDFFWEKMRVSPDSIWPHKTNLFSRFSWAQLFVRLAGQTWGRHSAVAF